MKARALSTLKGAQISAGGKFGYWQPCELQTATQREDNWVVWQRTKAKVNTLRQPNCQAFTGTAAPMFEAQGGLNIQTPYLKKRCSKKTAQR